MEKEIKTLRKQFEKDLLEAVDVDTLYLKYFSKKTGLVTGLLKRLPGLSIEEKRKYGAELNRLQGELKDNYITLSGKENGTYSPYERLCSGNEQVFYLLWVFCC